ncbi:MAG: hypothetical protein AB2693_13280 [Candidatus Thiodiazotropha sp.]
MQRTIKTTEEMEKMAKHKGRAYECLHCGRQGKTLIDVKSRVEDHILKYHLGLDQAPFYCSLCLFRSTEKKPLLEHVFRHSRHRQEAQNKNIVDSTPYLKESQNPYKMGSADLRQLSQEESLKIFLQKMQQTQEDRSQRDLLGKAFDEVFPHGIEDLESVVQETPSLPPSLQTQNIAGLQTAQKTAAQTNNVLSSLLLTGLQHTLQQSFGAGGLLPQLPSTDLSAGPQSLCGSTSGSTHRSTTDGQVNQQMTPATVSRAPSLCGSASGLCEESPWPVSSTEKTATELRSTLSTPQPTITTPDDLPPVKENILPQLLGTEEPEVQPAKSPAAPTSPPKVVEEVDDTPVTAQKTSLDMYFDRLFAKMDEHNKNIVEEFNKNTRAIRCMQKTLQEQVDVMNSLLRINAREERRREERREEERREERRREERREEERREERSKREEGGKRKAESEDRQGKRRKEEKENSSPKIKSVLGRLYQDKPKRK